VSFKLILDKSKYLNYPSATCNFRATIQRDRAVDVPAQRSKNRPNQIGTTVCRLAEINGLRVQVTGLDAVIGSPVLDLKPYVREFGPRGQVRQPEWMTEMMRFYWTGRDTDAASKI